MTREDSLKCAALFDALAAARRVLNATCFKGGDDMHYREQQNARNATQNCKDFADKARV
jgi:hypothetical protein